MSITAVNNAIATSLQDRIITKGEATAIIKAAKRNVRADELAAMAAILGRSMENEALSALQKVVAEGPADTKRTFYGTLMFALEPSARVAFGGDGRDGPATFFRTFAALILAVLGAVVCIACAPVTVPLGLYRAKSD